MSKKKTTRRKNVIKLNKNKKIVKNNKMTLNKKTPNKTLNKLTIRKGGASSKKTGLKIKRIKAEDAPAKKKPLIRKKKGLTVVNKKRTISPEQKKELKKLHVILTDPFIRQMLIEVGGENALVIVRNFYGNHSDEELSKNLSLRISDVRATLNRLHNEGLVRYKREKDSETGWYSYSWTLNKDRIVEWISRFTEKGFNGNGSTDYYFCPICGLGSIIEFVEAHECDFKCQKCTKPLEFLEQEHFSSINQHLRQQE